MKLLHKDFRKAELKVKVENLDDLWYLNKIIEPDDLVSGKTFRKIKIGDDERNTKVVRKTVFIGIKVEKVEFSDSSLRVLGVVVTAPEDVAHGSHHSFVLEQGTIIDIKKHKFLKYQIDNIEQAVKGSKAKIMVVVHDRESASFALLNRQGYDLLLEFSGDVSKKDQEVNIRKDFYSEILAKMKEYAKRHLLTRIILASPAFFKDDLMKKADDGLKKQIILATCNNTGKNGINEVLKRPEVKEALKEDRAAMELRLVEDLLSEIAKQGKSSYGMKDIKGCVSMGAVSILLVTDKLINGAREKGDYEKLEMMMRSVEDAAGEVHLISSENDAGKKLDGLGGIGAILRYKVDY